MKSWGGRFYAQFLANISLTEKRVCFDDQSSSVFAGTWHCLCFREEVNCLRRHFKECNAIGNKSNLKILRLQSPSYEMLQSSIGSNLTLSIHNCCSNFNCLPGSVAELKQLRMAMICYARNEYLPAQLIVPNIKWQSAMWKRMEEKKRHYLIREGAHCLTYRKILH